MYTRTAYIRRSRKTQRLKKRVAFAVAALLGVGGCAAALALVRPPSVAQMASVDGPALAAAAAGAGTAPASAATGEQPAARRIYPYSIVPGGVGDGAEVRRAVLIDKAVAVHYAGFDADKARAVTVTQPRAVYVSYRKGDKVYWSANKHTLKVGETLLSDGQNEIRGRCGNRISDTAQFPVEAHGPNERELDTAAEAQDPSAGGVQNVSFGLDGGNGGKSWQLSTYPNDAGLARPAAEAQARDGIGLPADGAGMWSPIDASRLLASAVGDSGSAGDQASGAPSTVSPPGSQAGNAPAGGSAPGEAPVSSPGAPSDPGTGKDGSAGSPGNSGGNGGNGDSGGGSGGSAAPDGGSGAPASPGTSPADGQPPASGGGTPGAPSDLPEVLLPTEPVTPVKPVEPVKEGAEVPEPGTLWLSGMAFVALLLSRRRKG